MSIEEILVKMKKIQNALLEFIENEDNHDEYFFSLLAILKEQKIDENSNDFNLFLTLVSRVAQNHHRNPGFFDKISRILISLKDKIKQTFSNYDIFNLFKKNKRVILILIEQGIIEIDLSIASIMMRKDYYSAKYLHYFFPEVKPFLSKQRIDEISKEIPQGFEEIRKKGESDSLVYEYIKNDSVENFISHVNRTNYALDSKIDGRVFETNSYLLKNRPTLIECAAFYGSLQIIKYLVMSKVSIEPSIWLYSIHSQNPELIHYLEQSGIKPDDDDYKNIYLEAIKCHRHDIKGYIYDVLLRNRDVNMLNVSLKYYNFECIEEKMINMDSFYQLCKYNYYEFMKIITNQVDFDPNVVFLIF